MLDAERRAVEAESRPVGVHASIVLLLLYSTALVPTVRLYYEKCRYSFVRQFYILPTI